MSYEAAVRPSLEMLCADCPLLAVSNQVEIARLEASLITDGDPTELLAAVEADTAANIVLAGVFKARVGCEGPQQHAEACECGVSSDCQAYAAVVNIMKED